MIQKNDLEEIVGREVSRVAINPGSVALSFGKNGVENGWILIQCCFVLYVAGNVISGKAIVPEAASPLLHCLEKSIVDASYDESKVLTLFFNDKEYLQLIPEKDGLESYVIHTKQGIVPVIDF
jgi:hypothetical protein